MARCGFVNGKTTFEVVDAELAQLPPVIDTDVSITLTAIVWMQRPT